MTFLAYAADNNQSTATPTGGFEGYSMYIMMAVIFGIFYFLMIRPQQKKQKELQAMLTNLAYGDTVVTTGGIHGRVTGLSESVITLEIADKVRIKVSRVAIGTVLQKAGAPATKE